MRSQTKFRKSYRNPVSNILWTRQQLLCGKPNGLELSGALRNHQKAAMLNRSIRSNDWLGISLIMRSQARTRKSDLNPVENLVMMRHHEIANKKLQERSQPCG